MNVNQNVLENILDQIDQAWDEEISFLQQLGRYPSTLGSETAIQSYISSFLREDLELETVSFIPDQKRLSQLPGYSPVEWSYTGRPVIVGQWRNTGEKIGKSLILQGHVDVVSPEPVSLWNYDPWASTIVGDRMYGRGIQDMKSGITAMLFATRAIKKAGVKLGADLIIQSVIEEECTGNGALAALDQGYIADGALIPEAIGPNALKAQVGVIWLRVRVVGSGAHVERADRAVNAIEKAYVLIHALGEYRRDINQRQKHKDFQHIDHPLNVNIGVIRSGDWASNVPAECTFEVRVGLYPEQDPQQIKDEIIAWLQDAAHKDEWFRQVPPEISFFGFHAEGVSLPKDLELFNTLEKVHHQTTGTQLEYISTTATTDIRFFNLYYGIPATCYGPIGANLHGADEWVDLPSVKQVTKTYAAFILDWCKVQSE
jgi:acetylornithine deacetylase